MIVQSDTNFGLYLNTYRISFETCLKDTQVMIHSILEKLDDYDEKKKKKNRCKSYHMTYTLPCPAYLGTV